MLEYDYVIREEMGMAIHYHCRHCGVKLGTLDKIQLGLNV